MRSSRIAPLVVVALLGVAGCSGDDEEPSAEPTKATDPSATTGIISPKLPKIPRFRGKPQGVISDIAVDSCDTEPGPVEAAGTATNSGKAPQDIVVVISWAVTTTSDVVARRVATLENVPAGDTVDWTVDVDLDSPEEVACVPTALRGTLRS